MSSTQKGLSKDQKEKANRQRFSQNSIIKIRNSSNVSTQHKDVARLLSQFYRNLPDTLIKNLPAVKKMNQNEMNVYVQKQFNLIKNQRVDSSNSNNGKVVTKLEMDKVVTKLEMDIIKLHDFFLFLWLDMRHDFKKGDKKIGDPITDDFDKFLKGSIVDQFEKDRNWDWNRKPIDTANMNFCRQNRIIGTDRRGVVNKYAYPGDSADVLLKDLFSQMWTSPGSPIGRIEVPKEANGKYYENLRKDDKSVYISFDSENSSFLSGFIKSSKTQGTRANGTQGDSYLLKRLYTLANLMDPGRLGGAYATPASSIDAVFSRLFNKNNPSWAFKINAQPYTWNFGKYFTIEIFQEGKTGFKCKLNNQVLNLGITKAQAGSSKGTGISPAIAKISKTFGDLNQILTVSTLRKSNKRVVSGTQDRAFIGMTGFIQRDLFDIKPQIISDATRAGQDYIVLFGMEDYYKNNVVRTRTGANSVVPTPKKSPSTGQNRAQPSISAASVGSVVSNNSTNNANSQSSGSRPPPPPPPPRRAVSINIKNASNRVLGKRKRNNTNNQSNTPAPKRREITSNSQLRINNLRKFINNIDRKLPGANSKVSNRLRTNNYVNNLKSKNTDKNLNLIKDRVFKNAELLATKNKFKKRVMNNLTNLSENNKNKSIKLINGSRSVNNLVNVIGPTINRFRNKGSQPMNANRNKLMRNLTKMILPNVVTKGYLQSYDNKSKTANQIIKEAKNFGKVIAMGQRQQKLGTLRPKPGGRG